MIDPLRCSSWVSTILTLSHRYLTWSSSYHSSSRYYAICAGGTCNLPITLLSSNSGSFGTATSAGRDGYGNAVVSYYDAANHRLLYRLCNGLDCVAPKWEQIIDDVTGSYFLLINSSFVLSSFLYSSPRSFEGFDTGRYSAIGLDGEGNIAIAYYEAVDQDLKFVRCKVNDCSRYHTLVILFILLV